MRYLFLAWIILCILHTEVDASENSSVNNPASKNAVYGSVGFGGLYLIVNANYERLISISDKKSLRQVSARLALGKWALWADSGSSYLLGVNSVWGRNNNHFEAMIGAVALFEKSSYKISVSNANYPYPGYDRVPTRLEYTMFLPAAGIGYRFQRPDGKFISRTGIGWPEALYVSFGIGW